MVAFTKFNVNYLFIQATLSTVLCTLPIISLYSAGLLAFKYLVPPAFSILECINSDETYASSNVLHSDIISPLSIRFLIDRHPCQLG